jgi:predicted nucleic acid-binding protein
MAREPFFLDTSGWITMLNKGGDLYEEAVRIWDDLAASKRPAVLTDLIVAETGNGMSRGPGRAAFVGSWRLFSGSTHVRVVSTTRAALDGAMSLYAAHSDKNWGLVDCVSFSLMRGEGIADAFTTDHHFEQAGFRCLLPTGGR